MVTAWPPKKSYLAIHGFPYDMGSVQWQTRGKWCWLFYELCLARPYDRLHEWIQDNKSPGDIKRAWIFLFHPDLLYCPHIDLPGGSQGASRRTGEANKSMTNDIRLFRTSFSFRKAFFV